MRVRGRLGGRGQQPSPPSETLSSCIRRPLQSIEHVRCLCSLPPAKPASQASQASQPAKPACQACLLSQPAKPASPNGIRNLCLGSRARVMNLIGHCQSISPNSVYTGGVLTVSLMGGWCRRSGPPGVRARVFSLILQHLVILIIKNT